MSGAPRRPVAILGGGAWGTALAVHLARLGAPATLWCRHAAQAGELIMRRENARYLPGVALPASLCVSSDLQEVVSDAEVVVSALPSSATTGVVSAAAGAMVEGSTWLSATKGLEAGTLRRMTEVARHALPPSVAVAALSGPSFAVEVAAGEATAVVIACSDLRVARSLQELVSGPTFRAYATDDVVGVELGGALKNVVALAAGMLSGLGLGHDPLAALITRGLHEIGALAVAEGARERTLYGLSGLGDLVLTCTGRLSRNRSLGEAVGAGEPLPEALARLGHVAEGVGTTARALELGRTHGLDLPITHAVADVLAGAVTPHEAIPRLMTRALRDEHA